MSKLILALGMKLQESVSSKVVYKVIFIKFIKIKFSIVAFC